MSGLSIWHQALLIYLIVVWSSSYGLNVYIKQVIDQPGGPTYAFLENINESKFSKLYEVTNGVDFISVYGDQNKTDIIYCETSVNVLTATVLVKDLHFEHHEVEEERWLALKAVCQEIEKYMKVKESMERMRQEGQTTFSSLRNKRRATRPTKPTTQKPSFVPPGNKMGNLFITNGTVWCGTGNKATSFDNLGAFAKADACCRSHDYCKHFIPMFETKYNFKSYRPYTISECDCDYDFYRCLKEAGTEKANEVGSMFFKTIGVPCFNLEYGEYCTDNGFLTSLLGCKKYEYGTTARLNYVLSDIWEDEKERFALP